MSETTTRTEKLRKLAAAATPGPWQGSGDTYEGEFERSNAAFLYGADGTLLARLSGPLNQFHDAAYIAALSPDVVSLLLDVVEAARVTGWNERDGRCWCPQSRENTGFDLHGSRCAALRAALDRLDS